VRIILPLPAGLATDLAARLFAEKLSVRWGQPVVVENRPGADGIVGVTSFVTAHDDHTLLFSFAGPISINLLIHEKLPYDPVRDLVPIAMAIDNFFAVAVSSPTGSAHSIHLSRWRERILKNSTGQLPQACRNSSSWRCKKGQGWC
jgi:tripartite-type tricarboxylate transporter receptor subunit TctC